MDQRENFLEQFRGEALGAINSQSSTDEHFQNEVLRPILKLQNELFMAVFANHLYKNKVDFNSFSSEKKLVIIEHLIKNDTKLRTVLKGMIMGFFTIHEYELFVKNSSSLNKRMMGMLTERLKSQVQLL